MPSLNWNLNANKVVMICFLELADMCQHGLSQSNTFWKICKAKFDALPDLVCGYTISSERHWHQIWEADQTLFIESNKFSSNIKI